VAEARPAPSATGGATEAVYRPSRLLPVALGTLIVPLDSSVNIAFPAITQAFGLPVPAIQWVVVSYVLTYGSLLLACGRIGDIFGHALVFRLGLAWSVVAMLLCAWAPSFGWLLAARAMQGLGAALVLSCGPALATGLFAEALRSRVLGAYAMAMALGSALGPVVGGALVQAWGWEAVFWFRAPIAALALLLSLRMTASPQPGGARERFDLLGAGLLALGLSALLLAVSRLRFLGDGELSGPALIVVGLAGLTAFAWQQSRSAAPIIDVRIFRGFDFVSINIGNVLVHFANFAVMLLVPYYLVRAMQGPLSLAGLLLAVGGIGTILASPLAGRWIASRSPYAVGVVGSMLIGGGLGLVCLWPAEARFGWIVAALALQGCGVGLFQVAYLDIVTAAIPRRDRGVAGSLGHLTRTLGVLSGATVLSLLFQAFEPGSGFLAAFQRTFAIAALAPVLVALATLLRARSWPR